MINPLRVSKAFSDKNRLKILEMLSRGDLKVGDVAEKLDVEENLASHHLRVLSSLGFLKNNKKGREVFYKINKQRFVALIKDLKKHQIFKEILDEALRG
ncbi:helix-turn-helix transcriptional regulator [candidate division WWE3 bacterium]|nr:helix-turn-helix transcriptional regulator [candidate division WWE3 bacterium]